MWGLTPLISDTGRANAFVAGLALALGVLVAFLGLAGGAGRHREGGRAYPCRPTVGVFSAYLGLHGRLRRLVRALVFVVVVQIVLDLTIVLVPVAIFLLVRWSLWGSWPGSRTIRGPACCAAASL